VAFQRDPKELSEVFQSCSQFSQHFTSSFCTNILWPNNYKAKLYVEKSCAKLFCLKKSCSLNVDDIDTWTAKIFRFLLPFLPDVPN